MKLKELIEENNRLRGLLTTENEKYYSDILLNIRSKDMLKNDIEVEETLLELLNDLLDAQKQGITAEDYFGIDSKKLSDEIIENIGNMTLKDISKFFLSIFAIFTMFSLFYELVSLGSRVDIGRILFGAILLMPVIFIIFKLINSEVYSKKSSKFFGAAFFLILFGYIGLNIAFGLVFPNTLIIVIEGFHRIIAIITLMAISTIYVLFADSINKPFLIIIWALGLAGIISCFEGVTKFLQGSTGIIVSILFTTTVLAVFYYFQLKVIKKY